jgi:hypothetical protein
MRTISAATLRTKVIYSLRRQGFVVRNGTVSPPAGLDKDRIRSLHATAVLHQRDCAAPRLAKLETLLLSHIADGSELCPDQILPQLIEVRSGSLDELLFRYASLHWSVPVSSGYGRRLRFLVVDQYNSKLIGLIGLCDPVYSIAARDHWIGWTSAQKAVRLPNVMEAFVLGAVPPYSMLLGGKLVALLAGSTEIRDAFRNKYHGQRSRIRARLIDGRLALVTTSSALGRSSVYNRLSVHDRKVFEPIGYTGGSGDFHFANGLYESLKTFADKHAEPSFRNAKWGTGFRNRRELIKKCLPLLGLSSEWIYHGIRREMFAVALASNSREFLKGSHQRLLWFNDSASELGDAFRERWLLPRAKWDQRFRDWRRQEYRLW